MTPPARPRAPRATPLAPALPAALLVALLACGDRSPPPRDPALVDPRDSLAAVTRATFAGLPPLPCASTDQDLAVEGDGVGPVRVGGLASEVARRCPATDTTLVPAPPDSTPADSSARGDRPDPPARAAPAPRGGPVERALLASVGGGVLLALTTPGDTITRVIVTTPLYRTRSGLGVGSRVAELRRAHGRLCATIDEGWVVVHAPRLPGVAFATSMDYAEAVARAADLQPSAAAVPDTTRVMQMWAAGMGKGPGPCQ